MAEGLIIIPTFNESENIEKLLRNVFSLQRIFSVLVVDDGSPDGTAGIVEKLMSEFPNHLHLLKRPEKSGLGRAYLAGFQWALSRDYDLIFEMDADFSHNPNDLIRLYNACTKDNYDMAIGSRYITGVNVVNWPMSRVLLSWGASKYVQWVTGMGIKDTTAGFVCYQRRVLEALDLSRIRFVGYAFQIEMKYKAYLKGFKIKEIPVIFTDRTKGASKMSKGIISEAIFGVLNMRFKQLFKRLDL
jgi:dolichol-phosphate mannosyltransferase